MEAWQGARWSGSFPGRPALQNKEKNAMSEQNTTFGGVEWNRKIWTRPEVWEEYAGGEAWSSYPSVPMVDGKILTTSREMWDKLLWPLLAPHLGGPPRVLEVAPGYGRCTRYLLEISKDMVIVDMCENCIAHCRERFKGEPRLSCHVNDGQSLPMIADHSVDLVFSWDSFVHINKAVTRGYVREFARVLSPEGVGLIHHSNAGAVNQERQIGYRSDMTAELMAAYCRENNLSIIYQEKHYPLEGGGYNDCITMFKK
jgi:SAM-dependent methyltransferase